MRQFSQVSRSKTSTPWWRHHNKIIIALIGAVLCILGSLLSWKTHKFKQDNPSQTRKTWRTSQDYHRALQVNLSRLKAMDQETLSQPSKTYHHKPLESDFPSSVVLFQQVQKTPQTETPSQTTTVLHAKRLLHPETTVVSGEIIHAVLETAIDASLPGMVRAIVSRPVYGYCGQLTLIPAGSRLIGQYVVGKTQQSIRRVMIIWHRILLPQGITAYLKSPSTDSLGRMGVKASSVDAHIGQQLQRMAWWGILGRAPSTWGWKNQRYPSEQHSLSWYDAARFTRDSLAHLQLWSNVEMYIHQGTNINVFVYKDIDFYGLIKK